MWIETECRKTINTNYVKEIRVTNYNDTTWAVMTENYVLRSSFPTENEAHVYLAAISYTLNNEKR
jgi:hypothetical protein